MRRPAAGAWSLTFLERGVERSDLIDAALAESERRRGARVPPAPRGLGAPGTEKYARAGGQRTVTRSVYAPNRMAIVRRADGRGAGIDLYWVPLGAGDRVVRLGGRAFEAIAARLTARRRLDLYHAALEVRTPGARFVIEVAPYVWGSDARACRGVVATGPVGSPLAGRLELFRYELRCWRDGILADAQHAVASPVQISDDAGAARQLLDLVASRVPHEVG